MHTTPTDTAPNKDILTQLREAQAEARLVMERVQTKALETLEALMDGPEPTGDPKQDAFIARERNRRRMAATQALIHIRTVQREERNAANARAKAEKQKGKSDRVPPTAGRPVAGPEPATPDQSASDYASRTELTRLGSRPAASRPLKTRSEKRRSQPQVPES
ncbi:hypothetical protein ABWH91_05160 [Phycisphaerales bacterium ac7]